MTRARLAVVLGSFALVGPAAAQPDPAEADTPFVFFGAHLGLDLPIGAVGAELGVGLDWFRAQVSTGLGLRGHMLVAGMVRAVHEFSGLDVGIGVGISRGPGLHTLDVGWRDASEPDWEVQYGRSTVWNDIELSVEIPLAGSAFARAYVGGTRAILLDCETEHYQTGATMGCDEAQRVDLASDGVLPYVGAAAGFRFPAAPSSKRRFTLPVTPQPFAFPPQRF